VGKIKDKNRRKAVGQTLGEFLMSMTVTVQQQSDSMMKVGTTLVDLTQELQLVITDLIERAIKSRKDLSDASEQIALHQRLGTAPETDEPVIEKAWTAVGETNAYLYAVTQLRDLCKNVLEREHETKH